VSRAAVSAVQPSKASRASTSALGRLDAWTLVANGNAEPLL
jgi:hypothetical protein